MAGDKAQNSNRSVVRRSGKNSAAATTGKQGIRTNKANAYQYKAKNSSHPLLKVMVYGYAIGNTINNAKIERLRNKMADAEQNARLKGSDRGSVSAYYEMYKRMDMEKALKKRIRKQQRNANIGKMIGSMINMVSQSGRTLAMRSAVSSSYGAANGIDRDDVTRTAAAVAVASMDDGQIEYP